MAAHAVASHVWHCRLEAEAAAAKPQDVTARQSLEAEVRALSRDVVVGHAQAWPGCGEIGRDSAEIRPRCDRDLTEI